MSSSSTLSKMISLSAYEAKNKLEQSLREAYEENLTKHLTPPLKLTILTTPQHYVQLNKAILYGCLCENPICIKYLHAIVNDGYSLFCGLLVETIDGLFSKMVETAKVNVIWVASVMVDVCGVGFGGVLVSLLRQVVGGDFSEGNLWLCFEMVCLFSSKWDAIFEEGGEEEEVMGFGFYCFLRLLGDHVRLESNVKSNELKRKEIGFCVRMLREKFRLCLRIGRDLIRVLQDLLHVPEFREIWKDLVLNPGAFRVPGFSGISQIYGTRTSSRYFVLRITPEMECQLRFLLTHVKFGSQKRHLMWFARKFLFVPERESLIVDIVRFICCAHHPPNEVLQSDVIPRWAVIGWLLNSCTKKYVEANVKLVLFYDWLFFDDKVDNVMNIEPAMLLMVNSIPKYVDVTHSLIEFLVLLADNYDTERKNVILKGVSFAVSTLVRAGVVGSLDVLTSCPLLSPFVKGMLQKLVLKTKSAIVGGPHPTASLSFDVEPSTVPDSSDVEIHISQSAEQPLVAGNVPLSPTSCCAQEPVDSAASTSSIAISRERIASWIGKIGETMKKSNKMGQQIVKDILLSFVNSHSFDYTSESLAFEVKKELELAGYKLFSPCESISTSTDGDDDEEVDSVTAEIIRIFIFSRNEKIMELLMCWSMSGCVVGVRLLSYALRLAYEAHVAGYGENSASEINSHKTLPLLQCHIDRYITFVSGHGNDVHGTIASSSNSSVDKNIVKKIIEDAFSSYTIMVKHHREALSKELDVPPGKMLSSDVLSCSLWRSKRLRDSVQVIFSYLADLSQCDEDVVLLILNRLQREDFLTVHVDVCLKRFSVFGKNVQNVLQLIRRSVYWEEILQHKLWALIVSELSVSDFPIEKLLLNFFYSEDVDPKASCIVIGGLMMLISCCPPTPELVGAVMLLPDNKCTDFAAAVLSRWVVTNESVLSNCVTDFFDKILRKSENVAVDWGGIVINQSAALFLLRYLEAQGSQAIDLLEKLPLNLSDVKARLKNPAVPMDPG